MSDAGSDSGAARRSTQRSEWVWIALILVSGAIITTYTYLNPTAFVNGTTYTAPDFVTGILTFDGIMIAAMAVFEVASARNVMKNHSKIVGTISAIFAVAALASLLSLRGFTVLSSGVLLLDFHRRIMIAFGLTLTGVWVWFALLFLTYFGSSAKSVYRWVRGRVESGPAEAQ